MRKYKYVIFGDEKQGPISFTDRMEFQGYLYEADITLSKKNGDVHGINGGRILSFCLLKDGIMVGYFNDGRWIDPIDDMDSESYVVTCYFIGRYNTKKHSEHEKILRTHVHNC